MATKKKTEDKKAKRKIVVIFKEISSHWADPVEFSGDTFTLLNEETEYPIYAIISEDPVSNVFIEASGVLAIGFEEDMKPLVKAVKSFHKN